MHDYEMERIIEDVFLKREKTDIYDRKDLSEIITESMRRILRADTDIHLKNIEGEKIDWMPSPQSDESEETLKERIQEYNHFVSDIILSKSVENFWGDNE